MPCGASVGMQCICALVVTYALSYGLSKEVSVCLCEWVNG